MKTRTATLLSVVALMLLAGVDLLTGAGSFSLPEGLVFWKLRLPRMLCAVLCGGGLALSGAQLQSILRNPLADPHILGVSGGAGLGAAIVTLTAGTLPGTFTMLGLVGAAFAGALLAGLLILAVSARVQETATLLIFGILLGFILSAVTAILQYTASEEALKLFNSWMAGSFSACSWREDAIIALALVLGLVLCAGNVKGLDIVLFGDDYAAASGAPLRAIRGRALLSCCLVTAAVTAFCGPVGFVGIVAPHLGRRLTGTAVHRLALPGIVLCGAALAVLADILANLWPVPLPASSTMALIGIPLVALLLFRK